MTDNVATPGIAHRAMAAELDLLADLMGGTLSMRAAGQRWLPREAAESWTAWRIRLQRTVLFNSLSRTVQALSGRPFARPVTLESAHPALQRLAENCDQEGTSLGDFAKRLLQRLLIDGMVHILVDRPVAGGAPYLVMVTASQLIGATRDDDGLSEIRVAETHIRRVGRFGEEASQAVRVIGRHTWQLWHPRGDLDSCVIGTWHVTAEGQHDYGRPPLITLNVAPSGFMQSRPPLIDLAWLNLAHWQSTSDQRHILHVARVPILFGRALQAAEGDIEIGPNRLIMADDPAADLRFVEHSGAAIDAGRQDLIDLEDRMAVLGLDMLRRRPGNETATGRAIDAAEAHAALTGVIATLRDGLQAAFEMAADWMDVPDGAAGQIQIARHFPVSDDAATEADILLRARLAGEISQEAFLAEITRRGILAVGGGIPAPTQASNIAPKTRNQRGNHE